MATSLGVFENGDGFGRLMDGLEFKLSDWLESNISTHRALFSKFSLFQPI